MSRAEGQEQKASGPKHAPACGSTPESERESEPGRSSGSDESHEPEREPWYYVYLLRCADGSLYTGITTDIARRIAEHRGKGDKAAKYTRTHAVVGIEGLWATHGRSDASRLEYAIKQLSHDEKLDLAAHPRRITELQPQASPASTVGLWDDTPDA